MFRDIFKNAGWFGKLFQLFMVSFFFLIMALLVATVTGWATSNIILYKKLLQLLSSVFVFLFPVIVVGFLWYDNPAKEFSLTKAPALLQIILVIALIISIQPFINLLAYLNEQIHLPSAFKSITDFFDKTEKDAEELTSQILNVKSIGGLMFNFIIIAIIPGLVEELYFRGAVQKIISEKFSKHIAVWVAAAIFSFIHFQMSGFFARMILGASFGYILIWTKTLWLPIIMHMVNNGLGVLAGYYSLKNQNIEQLENIGKADTFIYGILSGMIAIGLLWYIYKSSKRGIKI